MRSSRVSLSANAYPAGTFRVLLRRTSSTVWAISYLEFRMRETREDSCQRERFALVSSSAGRTRARLVRSSLPRHRNAEGGSSFRTSTPGRIRGTLGTQHEPCGFVSSLEFAIANSERFLPAKRKTRAGFVEPRQCFALLVSLLAQTRRDSCQPNVKRGQDYRPVLAIRPGGFEPPASGLEGRCSVP